MHATYKNIYPDRHCSLPHGVQGLNAMDYRPILHLIPSRLSSPFKLCDRHWRRRPIENPIL